jgi:2-hydroxy-6-oxonona-2,4-dienedioate hydrolase
MRRILFVLLAVLILAAVGVYAIYARDMKAARTRLVGRSQTIETSFDTMEYAMMGEGEPLLIVHGAEGGFDQGIDMTSAMAERGYRLIVPSRFGYLRSTMPGNPTTAMQADAYVQLLDHLGIDKVVVVGISAGAWSSMLFAIRHPDRCRELVLLVPANYLPAGTTIHGGAVVSAMVHSNFVTWALLKLMPVMPGGMTQMMLGTDSAVVRAADPSEKARVQQVLDHLQPVSQRIAGMNFDIKGAASHQPYPIEKIACPVLTISAEDDRFGTASRRNILPPACPTAGSSSFQQAVMPLSATMLTLCATSHRSSRPYRSDANHQLSLGLSQNILSLGLNIKGGFSRGVLLVRRVAFAWSLVGSHS